MTTLIYLTGPQGSGKTTLAHSLGATKIFELENNKLPKALNSQNLRKAYKGIIVTQQEPDKNIVEALKKLVEHNAKIFKTTYLFFHIKL